MTSLAEALAAQQSVDQQIDYQKKLQEEVQRAEETQAQEVLLRVTAQFGPKGWTVSFEELGLLLTRRHFKQLQRTLSVELRKFERIRALNQRSNNGK